MEKFMKMYVLDIDDFDKMFKGMNQNEIEKQAKNKEEIYIQSSLGKCVFVEKLKINGRERIVLVDNARERMLEMEKTKKEANVRKG